MRGFFAKKNFFVNYGNAYGNAVRSSSRTLHPSRGIFKPNNPPLAPLILKIKFPDQKSASPLKQSTVNMP